jgi:hypothetical protein
MRKVHGRCTSSCGCEQLRRSAVADAARRVVGESVSAPTASGSAAVRTSQVSNQPTRQPPVTTPQGPSRVSQTLYDIIGVSRHADSAAITAAIQAKTSQHDDSGGPPEERQRREILCKMPPKCCSMRIGANPMIAGCSRSRQGRPSRRKIPETPRTAYAPPPASGMIEAEDAKEIPSAGKRWAAYGGLCFVWILFLGSVVAPVLKSHPGQ